ncbi:hypothetical protein JCM10213_000354 [Rhodosporidiobolus nylandii]
MSSYQDPRFSPAARTSRVAVYLSPAHGRHPHNTRSQQFFKTPKAIRSPHRAPEAPARSQPGRADATGLYHPHAFHDPYAKPDFRVRAVELLSRPLRPCYAYVKTDAPRVNAAAERANLHIVPVETHMWATMRLHDAPEIFMKAVYREEDAFHITGPGPALNQNSRVAEALPLVPYFPQVERFLRNEADAAETFLTNVINPAAEILNTILYQSRRGDGLRVIVSSQHSISNPDVPGQSSALDFTLSLVSWPPVDGWRHEIRFDLCIIEFKRPGYIRPKDWQGGAFVNAGSAGRILLAQPLLYCKNTGCERFILSDYLHHVAVHIDHEKIRRHEQTKEAVHVSARMIESDKGKRYNPEDPFVKPEAGGVTPYEHGPMCVLVYECTEALRSLGICEPLFFPGADVIHVDGGEHKITLEAELEQYLEQSSPAHARSGSEHAHSD